MTTTAKVENLCAYKRTQGISVDESIRACINCGYYEQYYRKSRGNVRGWVPTSAGYCLLKDCHRGPLRQACKEFARVEGRQRP